MYKILYSLVNSYSSPKNNIIFFLNRSCINFCFLYWEIKYMAFTPSIMTKIIIP